ncbi:MAG TPA: tRNA preQ1(34) S-adenosylmethionine ribosyltransferase-isomerase QueA [Spirochaetota bacterium]|nr:tRNA preQ1(34) S-adenosylmethionine ribosyltransferase-isomerase QueA [Spirochaetota bacterium]HPF04450.1 tRNA preQ1(34) S-adenosylmethionine ribosyltransferase-isomerase QueA [Spirochaetota bacterium]HPJ40778.1 tRNA preQ1(34) S-adenosylmethionine ribosyltransferase-isomerase QueA [Spirochaetota bacterium]HPR36047.1 tRNA preQ1(34) S-adenosylmethionine ribosyltransferase-isomerase QueA [Spirochaetota bacterium]HRX45961.1 tRNA preQ1(34) S-adenosylmethionine ribosyltransferase-isomerase QueA [S
MKDEKTEYSLEDFYYDLPDKLIAQTPSNKRDSSRLFILNRHDGSFRHSVFSKISEYLHPGDLLVFNNAKVIHARIFCKRETGGKIEIVLAQKIDDLNWFVICNRTKRLKNGEKIYPEKNLNLSFTVTGRENEYLIINTSAPLTDDILKTIGEVPLPPYIKRESTLSDAERYQTVYASISGAVAAPTAGLHFTEQIINELKNKEIQTAYTTLFVSWGTFSPVRDNDLHKHKMHSENYMLDSGTAQTINKARTEGRRIIAVGTTSLRVLESTFHNGLNHPGSGSTNIFIYPPYSVKSINALITNLHTPYSTLLMLVSAFAGYDLIMKAYHEAVMMEYRFFSYGDAMFIL